MLVFASVLRTAVSALSLTLILSLAAELAHAQKRVALVVGNGAYVHVTALPNPIRDATAVAAALRRLQFEHVTVLSDLGANAFRTALLDFEAKAAGADIAVVYFAGHGIEIDGQNFLIPVDAKLSRAAVAELEAIPLSTVTTVLSGAQKLRLVILDACRNNPFRPRMVADSSSGRKRSIGRGLSRIIDTGDNELIVFAAAAGTEADDGAGLQSPFTVALLKHIETPGIDVRLMFGKVRDEVLTATGRQQTPHIYGTLGGDVIALAVGAANVVATRPAPVVPPPAPPVPVFKLPPAPSVPPQSTHKAPQHASTHPDSSWVKICDRNQLKGKDKDGREVTKDVENCMTLTEQIHPDTGMTMVGATVVQLKMDGKEKSFLQVTVPPGVVMPHGAGVIVLPKHLWEKVQKKQKIDKTENAKLQKSLVKLTYTKCVQSGCLAETEATPEFLKALKAGGGFLVHTVRAPNQPVFQPVPLGGFAQALTGPPTDTKKFKDARTELMRQIAERQKLLKK